MGKGGGPRVPGVPPPGDDPALEQTFQGGSRGDWPLWATEGRGVAWKPGWLPGNALGRGLCRPGSTPQTRPGSTPDSPKAASWSPPDAASAGLGRGLGTHNGHQFPTSREAPSIWEPRAKKGTGRGTHQATRFLEQIPRPLTTAFNPDSSFPELLGSLRRTTKEAAAEGKGLTLHVPQDVLLRRGGEEDVEPDGVEAVLLDGLLGVHPVVSGLAHLLPRHLQRLPRFRVDGNCTCAPK